MKQIPLTKHLDLLEMSNGEAATAKDAVKAMVESEGWKVLMRAIDARLKFEQLQQMNSAPGQGDAIWERQIGRLDGFRRIEELALGVIEFGEAAEATQRAAEAAA